MDFNKQPHKYNVFSQTTPENDNQLLLEKIMNTQNTELSDKISWSAPVQDIQNLVSLKAQADAKMTAATQAYNNVIATTAKSTAAPKLEAEADDIIADANQILNGLKAEDAAKDKKAAAPAPLDASAKAHTLVSRRAIKFGPERCRGKNCTGYRGRQNRTRSGLVCQQWAKNYPQKRAAKYNPKKHSELVGNYCRNPIAKNAKTIWCYTTKKGKRWEYCNVIKRRSTRRRRTRRIRFGAERCSGKNCTGYRGRQNRTRSGLRCQAWNKNYPQKRDAKYTPQKHSELVGNYCRNPIAKKAKTIWCYTTKKGKRWEYCNVIKRRSTRRRITRRRVVRRGRKVVRRRGRKVVRRRVVRRRRTTRYYGVGLFKARQSSIYGKTKGNVAYPIYGRAGQHTNKGNGQWWMAYFRGGPRKVTMVRIWNRRNCCGNRISGALVKVGNQVCGRIPSKAATKQVFTIKCKKAIRGGSVKVQLTRKEYLHFHKIQVFASDRQRRVVKMRRTIKKSGGRKIVINVKSAGYKVGNYARIYFNGKLIRMRYGRGLNIVAWDQKNMRRIHAQAYDTFADARASGRIVQMFRKLPKNAIVAISCKDECSRKLSGAVKGMMKQGGSKAIGGLKYRESFAFIGVVGAKNAVERKADIKHRTQVTRWFTLGGGRKVSRKIYRRAVGKSRTRRGGWYSLRVESAGMESGNYARFSLGGKRIRMRNGRGLNIVAWHPVSFKQLLAKSYDTYGDARASGRMGKDLGKLPKGAIVAIACKDSCAKKLSKGAKNAIAWHGSKYIKLLKYRESFAFIGRKGFRKSVEQRGDRKHRAVLSWRYKVSGGRRTIRRMVKRRGRRVIRRKIVRRRGRRTIKRRGRRTIKRRRVVRRRRGGRRTIRRRRVVRRRRGGRRTIRRRRVVKRRGGNGKCRGACLRKMRLLQRQLRSSKLRWSKRVNSLKRKVNVRYIRRRRVLRKQLKAKKITRKQYKKKITVIRTKMTPRRKISKHVFKRKVSQLRAAFAKKRISRKYYLRMVRTWRSWVTITRSYYWIQYRRFQLRLRKKQISPAQFKSYTLKLRRRRAPRIRTTTRFVRSRIIRMRRLVKTKKMTITRFRKIKRNLTKKVVISKRQFGRKVLRYKRLLKSRKITKVQYSRRIRTWRFRTRITYRTYTRTIRTYTSRMVSGKITRRQFYQKKRQLIRRRVPPKRVSKKTYKVALRHLRAKVVSKKISKRVYRLRIRRIRRKITITRTRYRRIRITLKRKLKTKKISIKKYRRTIRRIRRRRAPIRRISRRVFKHKVIRFKRLLKTKKISRKVYTRRVRFYQRKITISRRSYTRQMVIIRRRMSKGTITSGKANVMIRSITRRRAPIRHISKKRYTKVVMRLQKRLATKRISKVHYRRSIIRWKHKIVISRRSYKLRYRKYKTQLKLKKISKRVYRRRIRIIRRRVTRRIAVKTYYRKTSVLKKKLQTKKISKRTYARRVISLKRRAGLIKRAKNGKVCVKKKVMDNLLNCKNCKKTAAKLKKTLKKK